METLLQDIRYGLRMLRKNPGFTLVAVLTLALGIGANTAIFSLINALVLKPLPVTRPQELVVVGDPAHANWISVGTPRTDNFSYPLYRELSDHNGVFSGMLASGNVHRSKVESERYGLTSEQATGTLVTGNYFSVLAIDAAFGRTLMPEDDGAPGAHAVVVLSYDFWKQKLAQRADVIGQTLRINNFPYIVVGIAAPNFFGDTVGEKQDFWVPMAMQSWMQPGRPSLEDIQVSWLRTMGRLKPGITVAQAESNLNLIFQQWLKSPPVLALDPGDQKALAQTKVPVVPGGRGFSGIRQASFVPLMLLMGIVGLVLLIACVNVANLLLARATARQKEVAIRLAIGATNLRLIRQLLTESLLLSILGALAALLLANWGTRGLLRLSFSEAASAGVIVPLDARVLAFTASLCVVTGLLFGLVPALRAARVPAGSTLKEAGFGQGKTSRLPVGKLLVAAQVSICLLVLFAAGLLLRSLSNLKNVNLGYSKDHILMMRADPVPAGYKKDQLIRYQQEMLARLKTIPGVRGVTASENGLFSGTESGSQMKIEGYVAARDADRDAAWDQVGPDYFKALGIPILLGREFGPEDTPTSPRVAVINETMSRFYFGNTNPIGRRIWIDNREHQDKPFQIIGVVRDSRQQTLRDKIERRFYMPTTQPEDELYAINFEIRTTGKPEAIMESARKTFASFDANVPLQSVHTVEELVDSSIRPDILIARLSVVFGIVALLLACVGLYGLMSYTIGSRTREIGLRMALGAQRMQVLKMVLAEALKLVLAGVVVGVPAALAASQLLSSVLFGLKATDPLSLMAVILLLGVVAALAAAVPAYRAAQVDPMVALRYE
jgi:predicted permease